MNINGGGRRTLRAALNAGIIASVASGAGSALAQDMPDTWSFSGDLRSGYYATERTPRTGTTTDSDDLRLRLRIAAQRSLTPEWRFRVRAAGRYSSEQDEFRFYLRAWAPERTGARLGDTTLDELYLDYAPDDAGWQLRVGRIQTKFELAGVAAKGLDRNDSPNVDVNWTDGLHLMADLAGDWRGHAILQYNHRRGPGSVAYAPLYFDDADSRVSAFGGLENTTQWGPVIQRMVSVTWMPDALATEGPTSPVRDDYVTIVGRIAGSWPLGDTGLRLVAGTELGYAPRTPRAAVAGTGPRGDADGVAWQVSANLYDIRPGHHLGIVYGRAGAGWLISPDFRANDTLAEVRYQWRLSPRLSFEARYRIREELDLPPGAPRAREDSDLYARVTMRF
jgi:hypothetical protein